MAGSGVSRFDLSSSSESHLGVVVLRLYMHLQWFRIIGRQDIRDTVRSGHLGAWKPAGSKHAHNVLRRNQIATRHLRPQSSTGLIPTCFSLLCSQRMNRSHASCT